MRAQRGVKQIRRRTWCTDLPVKPLKWSVYTTAADSAGLPCGFLGGCLHQDYCYIIKKICCTSRAGWQGAVWGLNVEASGILSFILEPLSDRKGGILKIFKVLKRICLFLSESLLKLIISMSQLMNGWFGNLQSSVFLMRVQPAVKWAKQRPGRER